MDSFEVAGQKLLEGQDRTQMSALHMLQTGAGCVPLHFIRCFRYSEIIGKQFCMQTPWK